MTAQPYYIASGGVVRLEDLVLIPLLPRNAVEAANLATYLAWVDANPTNIADPDPTETLAQAKTRAKADLARLGGTQRRRWLRDAIGEEFWWAERLAQAKVCALDGTPETGDYPLLDVEVGHNGADLPAVATAVLAEWATLESKIAGIEAVRLDGDVLIDAATTIAETAAIAPATVWPA